MRSATRRVQRRFGSHGGNSSVRGISRDISGSVLPMMAAGILVAAALIGGGVDMARAYKAERRLQAACDAGALAGRRAITTNGFDGTAQAQANQFFNANFDDAQQQTKNTVFTPSSPDNGSTVVGTATTRLNTIIMKIFGFQRFDLAVACSASMGVGNSDIIMVLDNTGSMAWAPDGSSVGSGEVSRMTSLKAAMKNFYDTVATSVAGSNARIRYAFVPYSSAVRVGELITDLNSDYIVDEITVQSLQYVNWSTDPIATWSTDPSEYTYTDPPTTVINWADISSQYSSRDECNAALPANTAWADHGSPTYDTPSYSVKSDDGHQIKTTGVNQNQRRKEYRCSSRRIQERTVNRRKESYNYEERTPIPVTAHNELFKDAVRQQRTIDVSIYKTFASVTIPVGVRSSGTRTDFDDTTTWPGCIVERQTTPAESFTFVSLEDGITPGEALDLDIDAAPTSDDATKWAPLWRQVAFNRADVAYEKIEHYDSSDHDDDYSLGVNESRHDNAEASSACPYEARLFAEMTEGEFDAFADALTPTGNTYHDIGLLWGARLSSPTGMWADLVNEEADNGGTVSRHMIFMTDGELDTDLDLNTSYGIESLDKRVTGDGSDDDVQLARHRSRWLAICEAIKARGIRLWVIAFGAGVTLSSDLTTCASEDSAFMADDADELDETFQEIANQVGELRIIQ